MNSPALFAPLLAAACLSLGAVDATPKAASAKICTTCHTTGPGNLRGNFDNLALKTPTFQLRIDDHFEVLRFDKASLKVITPEPAGNAEAALRSLAKGHEVRVQFTEKDGEKTAVLVVAKSPVKVAEKDTISLEEVQRLVALGPDKGHYFLVDCRPASRFMEGAIPTAVNLPFPAFDKNVDQLPGDRKKLIIYYCSGRTCNMSPGSLQKVKALGYTNAKVFVDGMPAWARNHPGVLSPASLQAAYFDTQTPLVILDARPAALASQGFIKGSVSVDPDGMADLLSTFPAPHLKPPVVVVDETGGERARAVALDLVKAGYTGVNVLTGGFRAWQAAALPVETGPLASRAFFVPKPRQGSVSPEEFTRIALLAPASRPAVILDVRNPDETKGRIIKGAHTIPQPQLLTRLAELPRDKRILCHCSTGIRAELAYHLLKNLGYDIQFLPGEITIVESGEFTID
ncbi:MAG: rhodanese-like domain-containing protein [Geothrix sp.]|nr:rhodanese-like domain-containing protein [Geothrix sp.]